MKANIAVILSVRHWARCFWIHLLKEKYCERGKLLRKQLPLYKINLIKYHYENINKIFPMSYRMEISAKKLYFNLKKKVIP